MGTPFKAIYDTFLGKIEQDEWNLVTDLINLEQDWKMLLKASVNRFRYPRIALDYDEEEQNFKNELGQQEIELLATFMKNEWLKRGLYSWTLLRQEYSTKDFQLTSQANHMDKLKQLAEYSDWECLHMTNLYSRVIDHKPVDWATKFAGGNYGN